MVKKVSKDIPLAEITLRKYEKPDNFSKRDLIKKLCLSIGLLQPGDSRDVIVDIFHILKEKGKEMTSEEVREEVTKLRKELNLQLRGIAGSNIRRQLKRLRDMHLIEKIRNNYRINENESLINLFEEKIERFFLKSIVDRVKEYFKAVK